MQQEHKKTVEFQQFTASRRQLRNPPLLNA